MAYADYNDLMQITEQLISGESYIIFSVRQYIIYVADYCLIGRDGEGDIRNIQNTISS